MKVLRCAKEQCHFQLRIKMLFYLCYTIKRHFEIVGCFLVKLLLTIHNQISFVLREKKTALPRRFALSYFSMNLNPSVATLCILQNRHEFAFV